MTREEKSALMWHVWIQYMAHVNFLDEWLEQGCKTAHIAYSLTSNMDILSDPIKLMRHTSYCPYFPTRDKQIQSWEHIRKGWEKEVCSALKDAVDI